MAEILITGMEMPKYCIKCPFGKSKKEKKEYIWFCSLTNTECENVLLHNKDCPLVEVPPHGDLKDADVIGNWHTGTPTEIKGWFLFKYRAYGKFVYRTVENPVIDIFADSELEWQKIEED